MMDACRNSANGPRSTNKLPPPCVCLLCGIDKAALSVRLICVGMRSPYGRHCGGLCLRTKHFNNSSLDYGRLRSDLHLALQLWARHSRLTFSEVNSDNADILVYFEKGFHGDGFPFDGAGQVLAHAFFPGQGRGGDVHFDIEENWLLTGDEDNGHGVNLFLVAAHEFGHSLGLSHSSVPGSLMYPWYNNNNGVAGQFQLSDDDRYGIQQIYGAKEKLWSNHTRGKPSRWPLRPPTLAPPREGYRPSTPVTESTRTTTRTTTTTTRRPTTRKNTWGVENEKPDTCNTDYDAISIIRKEVFIFKGKYLWRIGDRGLYAGYPALTSRLWNNLPTSLHKIDAVYERLDKKIVFFIGRWFYVFDGTALEPTYPRPLTTLGLPKTVEKIDAAMIWGYNSKTYFFSGTMYWKFDEDEGRVELDYPRDMANIWKGVGYNIDAAFQWKDGNVYFFKGKGFWKFNDRTMNVEHHKPTQSSHFWMGCPSVDLNNTFDNEIPQNGDRSPNHSHAIVPTSNYVILGFLVTIFRLWYR
ncbi:matrix metalloproteinase [Nesidiocoris tenuis]|uniref:Matrix metalloproteinase n=1 Tax=Nesidiocoris tenuis TaxID=355587 RepID=A0ABN7AUE6_9HEMI|nr:matrix metalloproteinase [Nesidiocoris tenuis]